MPLAGLYWSTWCCRCEDWVLEQSWRQLWTNFLLPHQNAATSCCCTSTSSKQFFLGFLVVMVLKCAKFEAENAHNAFAMSWAPIIRFLKVCIYLFIHSFMYVFIYILYMYVYIYIYVYTCRWNHVKSSKACCAQRDPKLQAPIRFSEVAPAVYWYSNVPPQLSRNENEKQWAVDPQDRKVTRAGTWENPGKDGKKWKKVENAQT